MYILFSYNLQHNLMLLDMRSCCTRRLYEQCIGTYNISYLILTSNHVRSLTTSALLPSQTPAFYAFKELLM